MGPGILPSLEDNDLVEGIRFTVNDALRTAALIEERLEMQQVNERARAAAAITEPGEIEPDMVQH